MQESNTTLRIVPEQNPPAQLTPEQIEATVDRNGEVYRRDLFKTAWKTRSQGLWAGGLIGMVTGAAIGALTALSTVIVGATLAAASSLILPVAAAFAVGGMLTGVAAFTDVGSNVGAQVGDEKVQDRKRLLNNPTAAMQESIAYRGTMNDQNTGKHSILPFTKGSKKIFNLRAGLIFAAAGLAFGGLLVATGGLGLLAAPAITGAVGTAMAGTAATATAAIHAMTLTACTLFGAFFGVDVPTIGANANAFIGSIFTGKSSRHSQGQVPQMAPQTPSPVMSQITAEDTALLNERQNAQTANGKSFTQTIINQTMQAAPANQTPGV